MISTGFDGLDAISGGLQEKKNYLVYGNIGAGKTTFALQFLYQGLISGEKVAYVTRRSTPTVFDHGHAFGMDLEHFAQNDQLILFEYVPRVIENAARLKDDEQMSREFNAFLAGEKIHRLVFDPITPLLTSASVSAAIFRARGLIQAFNALGTTCLYMFDTPEGEEYLGNCKDFVAGVMRFETVAFQSTQGRLVLERLSGLKGRPGQIQFEVTPGIGLIGVAALAAPGAPGEKAGGTPAQRKVLIIESDAQQREFLHALLEKRYALIEADGAADGLTKLAAESPDLILMDRELKGLDGLEICREIRKNRMNVPIVLLADRIRRTRDRVAMMEAGADECLERPVDGRILKLKVQNLLRRYDGPRVRQLTDGLDSSVTTGPARDPTTSTTNLAYFYDRVRWEVANSTENGISFAVLSLRLPEAPAYNREICDLAATLIRDYDLVFVNDKSIGVLLAEADEKGVTAFLTRFQQRWNRTPTPTIEHACFTPGTDFLAIAKRIIEGAEQTGDQRAEGVSRRG
jgi:DNA-binding response OmpR family regulator/KaiC/GvpD/RAD55 family RecA-like ATPase